ncbi:arginase family protein [Desulfovibrio sp. OttesenSCG-928-C06]|nr:arginase family protein [Desulfovibrio sp. OttesenSCG-928-C06]
MAKSKTLRLLMPQWQGGGDNPVYPLGARLLTWLAPQDDATLVEVPVEPYTGAELKKEGGVMERTALLRQLRAARSLIDAHQPEKIITFGGDCLVSQAPFAYMNERHEGNLGVLWIDAHPDVRTPAEICNVHAMVLANLLGEGDPEFAAEVKRPLQPSRVMFVGLQTLFEQEAATIGRLGIHGASAQELADSSEPVLRWIRDNNIRHLAIHLDLDVLDPAFFRSLQSTNPEQAAEAIFRKGEMTMQQISRLINDAAEQSTMVALTIAELMPWDMVNMQNMLNRLPLS